VGYERDLEIRLPSAATVRLTPSMVMKPFMTT